MIPDIHSVFAESRLVYRIIELENRLKEQEELNKKISNFNNYIVNNVLIIDRKQRRIGKHVGGLTTFTIGRIKNLEQRLGEREEEMEVLTVK